MESKKLKEMSLDLQKAFLQLKNKNDVFDFLRDLLTEDEIVEFSLRFTIAKKLWQGENYKEIEEKTGASSRTIARVAKFLKGTNGGYRNVFKE